MKFPFKHLRSSIITVFLFLSLTSFSQRKNYAYAVTSGWGITNQDLKVIVPPTLSIKPEFHDGQAAIVRIDLMLFGLVDSTGNYRIPPEYSLLSVRRNAPNGAKYLRDYYVVGKKANKQYLFSFDTGEQLAPPFDEFIQTLSYRSDLWSVVDNGKWGIYNTQTRKMALELAYDHIDQLAIKDIVSITKGKKKGLYHYQLSQFILPLAYDSLAFDYSKILFNMPKSEQGPVTVEAWKGKKYTTYLIADNGKTLSPLKKLSSKGVTPKKRGGKPPVQQVHEDYPIQVEVMEPVGGSDLNYADLKITQVNTGQWKISFTSPGTSEELGPVVLSGYQSVDKIKDWGLFGLRTNGQFPLIVSKAGKFGIIDHTGKEIIPPTYDEVKPMFNGFYKIKSGSKYGVISKKLELIKEPVLIDVITFDSFVNEWLVVIEGSKMGTMDSTGKIYIPH